MFIHNYRVCTTQELEKQFLERSKREVEKCAYWLRHVCPPTRNNSNQTGPAVTLWTSIRDGLSSNLGGIAYPGGFPQSLHTTVGIVPGSGHNQFHHIFCNSSFIHHHHTIQRIVSILEKHH
jgi:hypothetical protein